MGGDGTEDGCEAYRLRDGGPDACGGGAGEYLGDGPVRGAARPVGGAGEYRETTGAADGADRAADGCNGWLEKGSSRSGACS